VEYLNRQVDEHKRFGNSITLELTTASESGVLKQISVRGTLTEGTEMVARINEFDKLYFAPAGYSVMFLYDDRPGVLGAIGNRLAKAGINIEDVRNPHDSKTNRSLAIMKINVRASDELVREISSEIKAVSAFSIHL
jgi:D-3-phosphoglycerate dehydrogenase